ncbi:MAG: DUF1223 domain-containing protein [Sneathiella sp.]
MKQFHTNCTVMILVALLGITFTFNAAIAESAHQPTTVVELFTSQGCSSCPPADKLLGELIENKDILGLSFAVTYWDYIGWKDIFGSADNDARQVGYRGQFNSRYVYTPQMVIGGKEHIVGSDRSGVEALIKKQVNHATPLPLQWSFSGDQLVIKLPKTSGDATLWLVDIDRKSDVDIQRGENTGRIITYHNVVRKIRSLGEWKGNAKDVTLDLLEMRADGRDGCALIIQRAGYDPILAALEIKL